MTSADQTGQFHTGSSDRPATEPSVFQSMATPPATGVQAEETVTQQLADAAHGLGSEAEAPEGEPGVEAQAQAQEYESAEDLTVPELKDLLDENEVDYPSDARKADLVDLVEEHGLLEDGESGEGQVGGVEEDPAVVEAREKAQQTDADRVEALREEQQATEPPDEKEAEAITKANEEAQLAAHAAHLDALEVAEEANAEAEEAREAEAKEREEAEAAESKKAEAQAKKADSKTTEKK